MNVRGAAANKAETYFKMDSGYPRAGPCAQRPFSFIMLGDNESKHVWEAVKMTLRLANQQKETEIWMPIQDEILAIFPKIKADPLEVPPPEGFKVKRGGKGGGKKA